MIARKRLLPILVAVLMVFAMMPMTAGATYAASGDPAMNIGTEVLNQNVNTNNPESVWYADADWRVIGYNGSGAVSESGAVTLLPAKNLDSSVFDDNVPYSNVYPGSGLEGKVNEILNGSFTSGERGAIKTRTLVHGSYNGKYTDCIAGDTDITGVALWPLSTAEAEALNKDLRVTGAWWLRSPGAWDDCAAMVVDLDVGWPGGDVWNPSGVRPAFHLNRESVLFTSAAVGGKSSGTVGADALAEVGTNSNGEWKVTVKDNAHEGFSISKTTRTGRGLSVEYTGAQTGTNEYISAINVDETGAIKYYGRIAAVSNAAGTVTINTADKFGENDHLYVFNEQYNGDKKTDYASELTEVTVPGLIKTAIPSGETLTYNGESQTGVSAGSGYTLSGTTSATNAGSYQATATLDEGRVWSDWTIEPKTISWNINPMAITPAITLSATTYTYNGKARKPTITVTVDSAELDSSQYNVTYASGRKNVGTYKVTVKMKGNYSGSATATFKILPKTAVISKAVPGKKLVVVTLSAKPAAKGGSAYQIQYRIKGQSNWKTTTTKTKTKTIKKLKKGKRYQIKVRAYKSIGSNRYYGEWSKVKTTKKVK